MKQYDKVLILRETKNDYVQNASQKANYMKVNLGHLKLTEYYLRKVSLSPAK